MERSHTIQVRQVGDQIAVYSRKRRRQADVLVMDPDTAVALWGAIGRCVSAMRPIVSQTHPTPYEEDIP